MNMSPVAGETRGPVFDQAGRDDDPARARAARPSRPLEVRKEQAAQQQEVDKWLAENGLPCGQDHLASVRSNLEANSPRRTIGCQSRARHFKVRGGGDGMDRKTWTSTARDSEPHPRKRKAQELVLGLKNNPRQRPTLPRGLPRSTIGAEGLNGRVRNGNGCGPFAKVTGKLCFQSFLFPGFKRVGSLCAIRVLNILWSSRTAD